MRKRFEKRLDAEIQFHLDAAVQAYIADGSQPEEARRQALVDFGALELAKDEVRDPIRSIGLKKLVEISVMPSGNSANLPHSPQPQS